VCDERSTLWMIRNRHSSSSTKDRSDLRDDEPAGVAADQETRGLTSTSIPPATTTMNELDNNEREGGARRVSNASGQRTIHFFLLFVIMLTPCAFVGWGVLLWWTELSTHTECDMTWMHPTYERIESIRHPRYSLYRYRDARDPRPTGFDPGFSPRAALLFVPGHAGSYQQARSVGTHALGGGLTRRNVPPVQLERVKKSILRKDRSNATTAEEDDGPSWDVFGVDFREEPTGLHGRLVVEQSEFLADAIEFLERSSYREVAIVAHSLGGYSTLLAVARGADGEKRWDPPFLRTVVALASPLHHPVMAWDWTLREVHREIVNHHATKPAKNNPALVSISGGLRDEMIPPRACYAVNMVESLSVAAVDLLKPAVDEGKVPASLGMDHRAIVWCRNLLEPILEALNTLHTDNSSPEEVSSMDRFTLTWPRIATGAGLSLKGYSYDDAVKRNYAELRVRARFCALTPFGSDCHFANAKSLASGSVWANTVACDGNVLTLQCRMADQSLLADCSRVLERPA
jgi:pimeloyl-ACP methyl ester carboxylesterase